MRSVTIKNKIRQTLLSIAGSLVGERVLIACSGGVDSTALFWLLLSLRTDLGFELGVAHYNHASRGKEAERDEAFVKGLAREWELPLYSERMDWLGQRFTETRARTARYEFLRRTAQAQRARWVMLAHTSDDVVETLLLNLWRGGGSAGLQGMPVVREGIFIRPLLHISRAEILVELQKHQIAFMEDSSNADTKYLRNKLRQGLLPLLEREYNPRVRVHLRRTAEILAQENDYLNKQAQAARAGMGRDATGSLANGGTELAIGALRALHPALQSRVLSMHIKSLARSKSNDDKNGKGSYEEGGIYYEHIRLLIKLLEGKSGEREVHLPFGITARREYDKLLFYQREEQQRGRQGTRQGWRMGKPEAAPIPIALPGVMPTLVTAVGMRLSLSSVPAAEACFADEDVVFLDGDKISPPLCLRNWRAGDTIKPLGMGGKSRKLQDIFTDKKIPAHQRVRLPLLVDAQAVLWVPRVVLSESVRLTAQSRRALRVEIKSARGGFLVPMHEQIVITDDLVKHRKTGQFRWLRKKFRRQGAQIMRNEV